MYFFMQLTSHPLYIVCGGIAKLRYCSKQKFAPIFALPSLRAKGKIPQAASDSAVAAVFIAGGAPLSHPKKAFPAQSKPWSKAKVNG
ncbi:MAG: hypothetical protein LBB57_06925, partial [Clostridiales Family XIII bacterium]|nr:hypothetical protein [Clostridiales Family XIII bacterium]